MAGTPSACARSRRPTRTGRTSSATKEGGPTARYDRTLTLEVWYPAALAAGQKAGGDYHVITRDPAITATLHGQAVRDAAPLTSEAPFPLVIISHGYPGNRYLMSHLAENLASKGFVTVSIDHKDSTYDDQKAFASTLYNRPFDQLFVLNEMDRLGKPGSGSFLGGRLDASRTGLVGYSMGGYGVVNVVGGGYSKASESINGAPPNKLLADRGAANPEYREDDGSAHQGGDRDRAVGHGRRILGRGGLERDRDAGPVRRGQRGRCGGVREGDEGDLPGRGQCRSLSADVSQREPQRGGADSRARGNLRGGRVGQARGVHALRRRRCGTPSG